MTDWKKIREDFPAAEKAAYFISAGMSPIPTPVFERMVSEYRKLNQHGDVGWQDDIAKKRELCVGVGKLINAKAGDIAFMQNTSLSMSMIALSLKNNTRKKYNVVSMLDEFPATTVPFEYIGTEMKYVSPVSSRYSLESILSLVDENTLAVATSYVQYATGFRQDLAKLGDELKKREIIFIVNATQGFPIFPIDVERMHIDAMSASLHKWGMAGLVGAVFYTSEKFRKKFPTPIAGWLSVHPDKGDFIYTEKNGHPEIYDSAAQFDIGSSNLQGISSFDAAFEYMSSIGFDKMRERIFSLSDILIEGLSKIPVEIVSPIASFDERSASTSFSIGEKSRELASHLNDRKIFVSYRGGNIRVAINIFNNEEDIKRLLDAVEVFMG